MDCLECGGSFILKHDQYLYKDPYVGNIVINGIPYYKCNNCEDVLLTENMALAIDDKRKELILKYLRQYPIEDFISASEAASILRITRQALHKNRRIKHGFIYQMVFSGINVYLKQSVLQYEISGDGRFPLHGYDYAPAIEYYDPTLLKQLALDYSSGLGFKIVYPTKLKKQYIVAEEYIYVN